MPESFYTILTNTGKAQIANASALGTKVNFTTLKLGDGNGAYYNPTETQTALVHEVWSGNIGNITVDSTNANWLVLETVIPADTGGFMIREAGVFDDQGNLLAVGKYPETYKPIVSQGSAKDLRIRIILEVTNTASVTLKVDPAVILATKEETGDLADLTTINKENLVAAINEHTSQLADTTKKVVYLSSFQKADGETDDTGRLQRAINAAYGQKLIIAETISISQEVVVGQASIIIEGVSRSVCIINLTTANACIHVAKNNGIDIAFEVYFKNFEIHANNIAQQCLIIDNASQCEFSNVYLEKATSSNLTINNSGITKFERLYSFYTPIAVTLNNCNFVIFSNINFWANDIVFKIIGQCMSLQVLHSWIEKFNQVFNVDNATTVVRINASQSYFLDSTGSTNAIMCDNTNATSLTTKLNLNFLECNINFAITTQDSLFRFKTTDSLTRITLTLKDTYALIANGSYVIDNTNILAARNLLVIADNLESKTLFKSSVNGAVKGIETTFDNEQIIRNAFVLPKNYILPWASCANYTLYYNTTSDRVMIKDGTGNFRIVPFKTTESISNSSASDISTLVSDFNNLLNALRDSQII